MFKSDTLNHSEDLISVGNLRYNPSTQCLSSDAQSIYLRSKLDRVLLYMIDNKDRLVSREELVQKIWDGNNFTGDRAVTHSVCKLRKTLSELGEDTLAIHTLPKRGYALVSR